METLQTRPRPMSRRRQRFGSPEATGHCDGDSSVASLAVSRKVIQSMRRCLAPEQRVIDAPGTVGLLEGSNDGVESIDVWLVLVSRCLLTDFVEVIQVRASQR